MHFTIADSVELSFCESDVFNPIHEIFRTPENNGDSIQFLIICNIPLCALKKIYLMQYQISILEYLYFHQIRIIEAHIASRP